MRSIFPAICLVLCSVSAMAVPAVSKEDAKATVKAAIASAKTIGHNAIVVEISKTNGRFNYGTLKNLYITVYDMEGKVVAHGANSMQIGINM
jgi:cytochrome c